MMHGSPQDMTPTPLPRPPKVLRVGSYASAAPPLLVEYVYYALFYYSMLASFLGILASNVAGGMQLVLAAFCVIRLGSRATVVYTPLRLPFAFALSYLIVQITVYDESIMGSLDFIQWMFALIICQSLYLRQDFLHRCVLVFFSIGLITLPYLTTNADGRAVMDSHVGSFTNANSLGDWFGFCCLYFAIVSIETKRTWVRVAATLAAVGCLSIVGISVSRGALLGIVLGITLALRRLLRRGFVPLLVFIILIGLMFTFGVFDSMISHYTKRGTEDTGRMVGWPVAIERFLSSPLLGVGTSQVFTYVPRSRQYMTPHNSFIYVALTSGILPFALFVAMWIRAAQNAFSDDKRVADGPFRLPLLVYTFVSTVVGDLTFMAPWGVIAFVVAMASSTPYGGRRLVVQRIEKASAGSTL